jgi:hypothetical protein
MMQRLAVPAILGFLIGCTHLSITASKSEPMAKAAGEPNALTGSELAGAVQSESLMATLMKFRPSFLASRGATPLVSVDGLVSADVSVLRGILASDVCDVRLERGTSGAGHAAVSPDGRIMSGGDLIAVTLRQNTATPCPRR